MEPSDADVGEFIDKVTPAVRRRDAETLVTLMREITGQEPVLWGTSIGFGTYHYKYASGREGDAGAAGFAPRKPATVVYLPDGVGAYEDELGRLGPHTTGLVCLYIKNLETIDLEVLRGIVATSYARVTAGTYALRANQSGHAPS